MLQGGPSLRRALQKSSFARELVEHPQLKRNDFHKDFRESISRGREINQILAHPEISSGSGQRVSYCSIGKK
jgi:hypothetical protein